MKTRTQSALGRREFFARSASAPARPPRRRRSPTRRAADSENNDEKRKARYQAKSDHVKTYYRVNRYPS